MLPKTTVRLLVVAAAFLWIVGPRARAEEPPAKEPEKKAVPALAREIVKMKVVRVLNENLDCDRAEKTIEDQEKIGQLLVLFPEVGTDRKPDITDVFRSSGAAYQITLERKKGDPLYITIN